MEALQRELQKAMETFGLPKIQVQSQPTDLLQSLCLLEPTFQSLKNTLSFSKFKKNLETIELLDLQCLAPEVNDLEANFDVTYLMICAMFGYTEKGLKLILEGASVNIQNSQGLSALMFASMFQCESFAKMLIEKGTDVNLKDRRQMDALMWAALQGNEKIVKALIGNKADVHVRTLSGLNALHIAVEKGFDGIVEMLLETNIAIDSKTLDGMTPLMKSVCLPDSTIAKLLLKRKLHVNVEETDLQGFTALHISVMRQNVKCVDRLLKRGAKITCTNVSGMTPLMLAVAADNMMLIQTLLENGAKETIHWENKYKQTALYWAILGKRDYNVELLIKAGSNTNTVDICDFSPILYACMRQSPSIVKTLLKRKKDDWYKDNEFFTCLQIAVEQDDVQTTQCLLNFRKMTNILELIKTEIGKNVSTPLITAASKKNREIVKLLLVSGADVNSVNIFLQSVLAVSVLRQDLPTAELTVNYGADVNMKDSRGDTPLILAASTNNKPMVDFILKQKPNRVQTNNQGVSAIMESASLGNEDIVKSLYVKGYDLELSDNQGWTPLIFASFSGDVQTVKFLLDKGAKSSVCSNLSATPLIIASSCGNKGVVSLLLEHGACANDRDIQGQTALIHAALNRHPTIIENLLINGAGSRADVGAGTGMGVEADIGAGAEKGVGGIAKTVAGTDVGFQDSFGRTALMYAVQMEDLESMKLLLEYNANCCQRDINGTTPLMFSTFNISTECFKLLLTKNVSVNDVNANGNTALHFASSNGHSDIVALLLQHNADPNKPNENGDTPLMLAAANGYDSIVLNFLRCKDLDIDFCNSIDGRSAFMVAAQHNRLSTVQLLEKAEANVNAKSKLGNNALHLSVIYGFTVVANFLIATKKVNLNAMTTDGSTALSLCVKYQRFEILKQLLESGAEAKKVVGYSIRQNSLAAIKIFVEYCQLSENEKRDWIQLARELRFFEIVDFLEHYAPVKETKTTTTTEDSDKWHDLASPIITNAAHSISADSLLAASSSCSASESQADHTVHVFSRERESDIPDSTTTVPDQTKSLSIDDFKNKMPFIFQNCNVSFNGNISVDRMSNCQIGKQNTFNNMASENARQD